MQNPKPEKYFLSRAEVYRQNPTLRNRSLYIAQEIDAIKRRPDAKEFREFLRRVIAEIRDAGRLDRRRKRERVINALKNYVCEYDELVDETKLARKDIKRILQVLIRAKLVFVKSRPHYLNPDGTHGTKIFVWHDLEL